jgi:hypothetical protein
MRDPFVSLRALRRALPWLLATAAMPLQAAVFTVGAARDCRFQDLQQAIDFAATSPGEDTVRIASDQVYTAQALRIEAQSLALVGGFSSCRAAMPPNAVPSGSTVLSGAGGARAPVLTLRGAGERSLQSLQIRDGDNQQDDRSGCGGGIRFDGSGTTRLTRVGVSQNRADSGGGLCFNGRASYLTRLLLEEDVAITGNLAGSGPGGGIVLSGSTRLAAVRDRTTIALNRAPRGDGGGLHVRTPARATIASPGWNGLGVLYGNSARRGGAIAAVSVENSTDEYGCVQLYNFDAARPVRLHGNQASEAGGAIYLRTNVEFSGESLAQMQVYGFHIDGNSAPNGPAAFLEGDDGLLSEYGGQLRLNNDNDALHCDTSPARVHCDQAATCNLIEHNVAADARGQPTNGNVIELRDRSTLWARDVTMRDNAGTRLLSWSGGDGAYVRLEGCALVDNVLTQELLRGFGDGDFRLRDCTIAGNAIGGTHVLRDDAGGSGDALVNVLIDQPGVLTLAHPDVDSLDFVNQWVIASDASTLRPDPTVQPGRGRFVDPARGDYRLRIGSAAVDYAPAQAAATRDLDGRPRDVDLDDASANTRARDLGGYERQASDPWIENGDFVSDLRLFANPSPTHAQWEAGYNAPQSVGGSLRFSVPAGEVARDERRTALAYCFNVPAAGTYQVLGHALVSTSLANRDYPILQWRLRYASDDCSAPGPTVGEGYFGRSGSSWQPLFAPLFVSVDPARWTRDTTLELRLDVAQDPASTTSTSLFARFDGIEIAMMPVAR